jgi:hypothetical protein
MLKNEILKKSIIKKNLPIKPESWDCDNLIKNKLK